MDQETTAKLQEMDQKLDKIYKSAEATRNYFKWTLIVSIIVIVLPLIGLIFVIPQFLSGLGSTTELLNSL